MEIEPNNEEIEINTHINNEINEQLNTNVSFKEIYDKYIRTYKPKDQKAIEIQFCEQLFQNDAKILRNIIEDSKSNDKQYSDRALNELENINNMLARCEIKYYLMDVLNNKQKNNKLHNLQNTLQSLKNILLSDFPFFSVGYDIANNLLDIIFDPFKIYSDFCYIQLSQTPEDKKTIAIQFCEQLFQKNGQGIINLLNYYHKNKDNKNEYMKCTEQELNAINNMLSENNVKEYLKESLIHILSNENNNDELLINLSTIIKHEENCKVADMIDVIQPVFSMYNTI